MRRHRAQGFAEDMATVVTCGGGGRRHGEKVNLEAKRERNMSRRFARVPGRRRRARHGQRWTVFAGIGEELCQGWRGERRTCGRFTGCRLDSFKEDVELDEVKRTMVTD
jgi:hypothetical protein